MSVKLLTVEGAVSTTRGKQQISVTSDALATIGELPLSPLNLITIWGPARTGKSYIMNLLARSGKEDIFPVSEKVEACTVGADMSKSIVGLASFMQSSDAPGEEELEEGGSPKIGFVDVQGQGDRHQSNDILLATPLLLLSKVVIFNWLGKPSKTTVLDKLTTMREAATFINRGQQADAFGHLVLLLRDVGRDVEKEVYSLVFENEDPDNAGTDEEATGMEERNKTRNLLQEAFKTIRVVCMPTPHADIDVRSVSVDEVKPAFAAKLSRLRDTLSDMLREPHQFGGQPVVGGVVFTSLLSDLCERVNQGAKDIVPLGLMESIHQRRAESALEQASKIFETTISAFEVGPAQSKAATANVLEQAETSALDKFAMDTQGLDERTVKKAQATLDATIRQLTKECKAHQEKRVADAKVKVVKIMESVTRKIDDEDIKDILSALPIKQGTTDLNRLWAQKCQEWHEVLKHSIELEIPVGLHEDLESCVPTLVFFQSSINGKLEHLQALNQKLMEAQQENEERRPSKGWGTEITGVVKSTVVGAVKSRVEGVVKSQVEGAVLTLGVGAVAGAATVGATVSAGAAAVGATVSAGAAAVGATVSAGAAAVGANVAAGAAAAATSALTALSAGTAAAGAAGAAGVPGASAVAFVGEVCVASSSAVILVGMTEGAVAGVAAAATIVTVGTVAVVGAVAVTAYGAGQAVKAVVRAGKGVKAAVGADQGVKAAVGADQGVKAAVGADQGVKAAVGADQGVKAAVGAGQGV